MVPLDDRLAADSHWVVDWPLCQVRLMDDARFFWLVLVPDRAGAVEPFDLAPEDQASLWQEALAAAAALKAATRAAKINVGLLGNIVSQLHVHVVARRGEDVAWPGPVWGAGVPERLDPAALRRRLAEARAFLALTPRPEMPR